MQNKIVRRQPSWQRLGFVSQQRLRLRCLTLVKRIPKLRFESVSFPFLACFSKSVDGLIDSRQILCLKKFIYKKDTTFRHSVCHIWISHICGKFGLQWFWKILLFLNTSKSKMVVVPVRWVFFAAICTGEGETIWIGVALGAFWGCGEGTRVGPAWAGGMNCCSCCSEVKTVVCAGIGP